RSLGAQDALHRRPAAEGRALLGPPRGSDDAGDPDAGRGDPRVPAHRRRPLAHGQAGAVSGGRVRRERPGLGALRPQARRQRLRRGEAGSLRPRQAGGHGDDHLDGGRRPGRETDANARVRRRRPADEYRSKELFGGPTSQVTRLEISRGQGSLVLARREGIWWISSPIADLADGAAADRLVGELTALRVRDFIHSNEDLAALSLNPPLYRVSVTGEKGVVSSVDFGATRSDGNTV